MTLQRRSQNKFISEFKTFSDGWPARIRQSINSNLDGFISESGFMGEYLASLITGKKGTASAAAGFDLINEKTKKAAEVKLAVWVRSKKCKNCGKSFLFFNDVKKCDNPKCESTEFSRFKYPADSRWGIDAKAGIKYKDIIDEYVLQVIKPVTNSFDCKEFIYEAFLVDAKNKYFVEYLMNQYVNSKKSNNCNLLPYSYDFYRAEPIKVISLKISLNETNSNIDCLYYNLNNNKPERMQLNVLQNAELKSLLSEYSISYKKNSNKSELIGFIKKHLDIDEILKIENVPLRNKNLNKERGDTSRKIEY